jgi:hypothetical protein
MLLAYFSQKQSDPSKQTDKSQMARKPAEINYLSGNTKQKAASHIAQ